MREGGPAGMHRERGERGREEKREKRKKGWREGGREKEPQNSSVKGKIAVKCKKGG